MANVPDPCNEIRDRLEQLQTDPVFIKAVGENPATLVEGLSYENANLIVHLTKYTGMHHDQGGGGNTFGGWRSLPYP